METNLTREQKMNLLRNFLGDDICVKAMQDTFSEKQLDEYIDVNIEVLLGKWEDDMKNE